MNGQRIRALDAARGIAMLLVCVVHFLDIYPWRGGESDWFFQPIVWTCRTASPMFVLLSGILLGYQFTARKTQFGTFRIHLLDRALFTATVGHVVLALSLAERMGLVTALSRGYITDTLVFCVICGVYLISVTGGNIRLIIGMFLGLGSWYLCLAWTPDNPILLLIKSVLIGQPLESESVFNWPLFPWLGLYLVGSSVGEWIGHFNFQDLWLASRRLFRVSATVVSGAIGLQVVRVLMRQFDLLSPAGAWYQYIPNFSKHPPGSLYFLFYGGVSLLILSALLAANNRPLRDRICTRFLEPIGRNSLTIFITQFFLYYTLLHLFLTKITMVTPVIAVVLLLLSLGVICGVAGLCERYKTSRFLTTGVPVLIAPITGTVRAGRVKLRQAA